MLVEARLLVLVMVVASLMLGACGAPETPIDPAEAVEGCFWVGPYTLEREQTNTAFPDSGATYWSARFTVPNGARLRLRGRYPHARYMSFVSYNSLKSPTDSIYDTQISPETDHLNPFRLGARRDVESRAYGLDVLPQSPPDGERAENTIYADPRFDGQVSLFYRVYVPDQGFDATGGTGLPDVELVQADGSVLHGQPACDALQVDRHLLVSSSGRRWVYTMAREQPWRAETFPAQSRPEWRAFYNAFYFQRCTYLGWCGGQPERSGGVFSNPQNGYLTLMANRRFGPLLVLEGRMPDTPRTRDGAPLMMPAQLRYWSLCTNETFTQKVTDCLYDEQVPLDQTGSYIIVASRAEDRPDNARPECGIAWLEWPAAGDGAGHPDDMLVLLRNMLPSPDFEHAVQATRTPGDARKHMQAYLPEPRYMNGSEFALLGCDAESQ